MDQIALQLTGGNNKNTRRALDFYPTPRNVTVALLDFLDLPKENIIWEPACGEYTMSNVIKEYGYEVITTDIIYGQDFLDKNTKVLCDVIITNPPFSVSEAFIEKAIEEAPVVCMLLKSQYWRAAKRYKLFEKHRPEYVLPLTWRPDFLEHTRMEKTKGSPTMEVAWTVWSKFTNRNTIYKPLLKPK